MLNFYVFFVAPKTWVKTFIKNSLKLASISFLILKLLKDDVLLLKGCQHNINWNSNRVKTWRSLAFSIQLEKFFFWKTIWFALLKLGRAKKRKKVFLCENRMTWSDKIYCFLRESTYSRRGLLAFWLEGISVFFVLFVYLTIFVDCKHWTFRIFMYVKFYFLLLQTVIGVTIVRL